jgi:hypothetical protein
MIFGLLVEKRRASTGQGNSNTRKKHHVLVNYQVAFFFHYFDRHSHVANSLASMHEARSTRSAPPRKWGLEHQPYQSVLRDVPLVIKLVRYLVQYRHVSALVGSCGLANDNVFQAKLHRECPIMIAFDCNP